MTGARPSLDPRTPAPVGPVSSEESWRAGSVLLAGVLMGGGAGWLLARLLHWDASWPLAVGVLLGTAVAVVDLWFRYGARAAGGGAEVGAGAARPAPGPTPRPDRRTVEDAL